MELLEPVPTSGAARQRQLFFKKEKNSFGRGGLESFCHLGRCVEKNVCAASRAPEFIL